MKKIILVMFWNVAFECISWSQGFDWAKRAGLWAYDYGYGVAIDKSGNVYVAGKYEKNANFSGTILPCQGNHDIYLAKYSPLGTLLWVRTAGGTSGDYALAVATNGSHVFIAGEIQGKGNRIKFIGSSLTLTSRGNNDIFLAKYDLNGNILWARRAGHVNYDRALGIDADISGSVYISGTFTDKAVFGESTTLYGYGSKDIFVARYDPLGYLQWVRKAGGAGSDEAKAVKVDSAGNVYVCGKFKTKAYFGGATLSAKGGIDIFLAKYASSGNLLWVKKAGGYGTDVAWSLAIDNAGRIFVTGEFKGTVNFGGATLKSNGGSDIFLLRYNSSGDIELAKRAGGAMDDLARGIATDGDNIFITGQFGGTATFGSSVKTAIDSSDIFVSKISNNGYFLWTSTVGGVADDFDGKGYESGESITADNKGNVYVSGNILNGGVFGSTTLNRYKHTDIFIARLKNSSKMQQQLIESRVDLPVFNAVEKYGLVHLNWVTTAEILNDYFIVEKSLDGENFSELGIVIGAGISNSRISYSFIDSANNAGISREARQLFYRLNQTDYDGRASFSNVIAIKRDILTNPAISGTQISLDIYPNPVKQSFTVNLSEIPVGELSLCVYNLGGNLISETSIRSEVSEINVSTFNPGIYLIAIKSGDEMIFEKKIIVQEE